MKALIVHDPSELTSDAIERMNVGELVENAALVFEIGENSTRAKTQALMEARAMSLGASTLLHRLFSKYSAELKKSEAPARPLSDREEIFLQLKLDRNGHPTKVISNFLAIMRADPFYAGVRFNELKNAPEIHEQTDGNLMIRRWTDTDTARSQEYIERTYKIYAEAKHYDALRILWGERSYHPIRDIVDGLEWDGEERCEHFLTRWAKVDDSPYTREVSRLIFAGGIWRLYVPGCKFDDVPVLIGSRQGEGKSSLVKWLAIHDDHFAEIKEIEGQKAIEQLEGAWICEVAELLALTKAKEQEAVKSYITTQRDRYRRPFDRQISENPRRCIFVGTTNNEQFLKDKTGNRRFYPVTVHSDGYWLYDHEQECRAYILQCWAEARDKYRAGDMPNFARRELLGEYRKAQENAMEDDWRVGAIEAYLAGLLPGSLVCIRELKHKALAANPDFPQDPTPKESQEIATIMGRFEDWEPAGRVYTDDYGRQRCWKKKGDLAAESPGDLPF